MISKLSQALSEVYIETFSLIPSAIQALSPKEKPLCFVCFLTEQKEMIAHY
ncbi:hypothetical protein [Candidatus Tisiphia endosymbiont of Micropterix aruncella]|uniref:hypothetical protein n=1 Tax=Candidatus Tisiphia endosymbiont of Micropterix aruncella TaxID=3066271 RepID=UPI003AA918B9